jgi:hypothetical protein
VQILKYLVIFLCIITLNACGKGLYMLDQPAIGKETERLKKVSRTVCLGRYLVDLPNDAVILGQPYHYVNKFSVSTATPEQVEQAILNRIQKIDEPDGNERVIKVVSAAKPDSKIIVRQLRDTDLFGTTAGYDIEGFFWMSGNQYLVENAADADKLDLALADTLNVIALAQPRADDEIPTDPGFCMDGAFFPDVEPVAQQYESADLYLTFSRHRDVHIDINIDMNGDKVFKNLLTRLHEEVIEPEFQALVAMTIEFREGNHSVGAISGEERLQSIIAGDIFYNHSFVWESTGKPNDYYAPNIHVNLSSGDNPGGGIVRPSISDAEAIALFDFIVNSIRLRPYGEAAKRANRVPSAPIGSRTHSGQVCPETGWWEVIPPRNGLRHNPEYFEAGAIMPKCDINFLRRYDWMTLKFGMRKKTMAVNWELRAYPEDAQR